MALCRIYAGQRSDTRGTFELYMITDKGEFRCGEGPDEFILQTPIQYNESIVEQNSEMISVFETYFAFDAALFGQLQAWFLITFIAAFALGKTINILNISNR